MCIIGHAIIRRVERVVDPLGREPALEAHAPGPHALGRPEQGSACMYCRWLSSDHFSLHPCADLLVIHAAHWIYLSKLSVDSFCRVLQP
jgi:hypothetical protein